MLTRHRRAAAVKAEGVGRLQVRDCNVVDGQDAERKNEDGIEIQLVSGGEVNRRRQASHTCLSHSSLQWWFRVDSLVAAL